MRILLDIDGVICEYDFPKIVKNFFGISLTQQAIYAYDLADVLGVAPTVINMMFKEQVYGPPSFIEGALETLRKWESQGHELVIFSNRVKYMGEMGLAEWLVKYDIPFRGIDSNGEQEYDLHIDDSPGKLAAANSKKKLLFSQPWNEYCLNITGKLLRVKNWGDIENIVEGYYVQSCVCLP